jgi:hypothetical protein
VSAHPRAISAPLAVRLPAAWATALAAFAASRLLVLVSGAAAHLAWGDQARIAGLDPGRLTRPFGGPADALVAPFAAWDSVWYLVIANDAYGGEGPREAFFPLYPMLVDGLAVVLGSPIVAGVLLSSACAVAGLAAVHRLAELELGPEAARWAVWALALCPVTLFLSAVYSEGLFLALSAGALLAARQDRWALAGALGALASATRSAGVVLLVPLALLWWRSRRRPGDLGWLALVPAGLVAFCAGLAIAGEAWDAPFSAQDAWGRELTGPFAGVLNAVAALDGVGTAAQRANVALFGCLVLVVAALVVVLRRLPLWHGAYALAALALPLSWPVPPQPLMSLPRFALVLVPLWLAVGLWLAQGGPLRRTAVLTASAGGVVVCAAMFSTWHWLA